MLCQWLPSLWILLIVLVTLSSTQNPEEAETPKELLDNVKLNESCEGATKSMLPCEPRKRFCLQNSKHQEVHSGKSYGGPNCDATFTQKQGLSNHMTKHNDEMPHQCEQCGYKSKWKSNLKKHKELHNAESYGCPICHKTFAQKEGLSSHMTIHNDEMPHQCEQCDFKSKWKSNLKKHKELHSAESYGCPICHKTFAQKQGLSNHMTKHNDEMPHQCEQCDYKSKWKSSLNKHKQLHNAKSYERPICHATFAQKQGLINHMTVQKNVWYECKECVFKSKWKKDLKRHQRTAHRLPMETLTGPIDNTPEKVEEFFTNSIFFGI